MNSEHDLLFSPWQRWKSFISICLDYSVGAVIDFLKICLNHFSIHRTIHRTDMFFFTDTAGFVFGPLEVVKKPLLIVEVQKHMYSM